MHVIVFRIPAQSLNSCSGRFSRCSTTWRWFKKDRLPPYQSLSHFTHPEHTKQQTSSSSSVGTYFVIWGPKSQISRPPTAELIGPHLNAQISSLLFWSLFLDSVRGVSGNLCVKSTFPSTGSIQPQLHFLTRSMSARWDSDSRCSFTTAKDRRERILKTSEIGKPSIVHDSPMELAIVRSLFIRNKTVRA